MTSESGFVWSMNCDSCEDPKNSLIEAMTGFELIRSCGIAESMSWWTDIFSLMARSIRTRPMRNWFSSSSPTERTRRLPRLSMSSVRPTSRLRRRRYPTTRKMSAGVSVRVSSEESASSLMLNLKRPTREKSYFLASKNMPSKRFLADS